jgi:putative PIN family toxin of toxin-antitoxin system
VIAAWLAGEFDLVLSEHILEGTARAWAKQYFQTRFTQTEVRDTLALLRGNARFVVPIETIHGVCEDEEDDLVLATAIAADVSYLVTGDIGMLNVRHYRGITILTPRDFLDLLDQQTE